MNSSRSLFFASLNTDVIDLKKSLAPTFVPLGVNVVDSLILLAVSRPR